MAQAQESEGADVRRAERAGVQRPETPEAQRSERTGAKAAEVQRARVQRPETAEAQRSERTEAKGAGQAEWAEVQRAETAEAERAERAGVQRPETAEAQRAERAGVQRPETPEAQRSERTEAKGTKQAESANPQRPESAQVKQAQKSAAEKPTLRVGMIGYAFMGAAHSQGWRTAGRVFDLPRDPVLSVICGRNATAVRAAADRHGWAAAETDWRALIERDDVDLVDICTPGDSHAEIALAALAAGKHVLCEKPLANTVAEAETMTAAAEAAYGRGQLAMVGFNYRRLPATALARSMVADGRLGALRHVRVTYLQDWLVDPQFPLTWRLRRELAGSGSLGDLGAHIVDLAQYLTGEQLAGVSALTETFVRERPLPTAPTNGLAAAPVTGTGPVTVDDAALFTGRFPSGALASFEATRYATGRKNALRIELNGAHGSLAFDLERLNELAYHDGTEPGAHAGFRRILVTEPDHPYLEAWWPPGHGLGYEHTFVHQARDLVHAIDEGRRPEPSFADGLQVQRVLAAVEESAEKNSAYTPVAV